MRAGGRRGYKRPQLPPAVLHSLTRYVPAVFFAHKSNVYATVRQRRSPRLKALVILIVPEWPDFGFVQDPSVPTAAGSAKTLALAGFRFAQSSLGRLAAGFAERVTCARAGAEVARASSE